jgi:peptidoglycan/LPS O-acetylase OafA/YrhL
VADDSGPVHRPIGYQPAFDGLRALAVVAVIAYHAGMPWMPGGLLGVDAFFVLSGFLITGLLIAEYRTTRRIDLKSFWTRRARRLLPALLLMLLGVAAYASGSPIPRPPAASAWTRSRRCSTWRTGGSPCPTRATSTTSPPLAAAAHVVTGG